MTATGPTGPSSAASKCGAGAILFSNYPSVGGFQSKGATPSVAHHGLPPLGPRLHPCCDRHRDLPVFVLRFHYCTMVLGRAGSVLSWSGDAGSLAGGSLSPSLCVCPTPSKSHRTLPPASRDQLSFEANTRIRNLCMLHHPCRHCEPDIPVGPGCGRVRFLDRA
jgi:hypothetical protein